MPNYPTHARWGRIGAVVMAGAIGGAIYALFALPLLAVAGALAAGVTTFVGAIYPDVDHHTSVPRQKAVRGFQILVWLGVVSLGILNWNRLVALVDVGVVEHVETASTALVDGGLTLPPEFVASAGILLTAVFFAGLVDPALGFATRRHRGWTHSVPINFLLTAVIAGGVWLLTTDLALSHRVAAVAVVATFFVGSLVHLGLDGEIS